MGLSVATESEKPRLPMFCRRLPLSGFSAKTAEGKGPRASLAAATNDGS